MALCEAALLFLRAYGSGLLIPPPPPPWLLGFRADFGIVVLCVGEKMCVQNLEWKKVYGFGF
jgi:hypothetical protein